jgi:hypothetical protein
MMSGERAGEARQHEEGLAVFLRPDRRARFLLSLSDERLRRKVGSVFTTTQMTSPGRVPVC